MAKDVHDEDKLLWEEGEPPHFFPFLPFPFSPATSDWDDDQVDDEFAQQLRSELTKSGHLLSN